MIRFFLCLATLLRDTVSYRKLMMDMYPLRSGQACSLLTIIMMLQRMRCGFGLALRQDEGRITVKIGKMRILEPIMPTHELFIICTRTRDLVVLVEANRNN